MPIRLPNSGGGNATVPGDAPLTPQPFVDVAYAITNGDCIQWRILTQDSANVVESNVPGVALFGTTLDNTHDFSGKGVEHINFDYLATLDVALNLSGNSIVTANFPGLTNLQTGGIIHLYDNSGLLTFVANALTTINGSIDWENSTMTTFSMNALRTVGAAGAINFTDAAPLASLVSILAALTTIQGEINLTGQTFTNLAFTNATVVSGTIVFTGVTITGDLSFPAATAITATFTGTVDVQGSLKLNGLTTLTGFTLPTIAGTGPTGLEVNSLVTLASGSFSGLGGNTALETASFNSLTTTATNALDFAGCTALVTLDLPVLATIPSGGSVTATGTTNLVVDVGDLATLAGLLTLSGNTGMNLILGPCTTFTGTFDLTNNAFDEGTVDGILVALAATVVTGTGGTLDLTTNAIPSATGLAAKATLEGKGLTVNVDS